MHRCDAVPVCVCVMYVCGVCMCVCDVSVCEYVCGSCVGGEVCMSLICACEFVCVICVWEVMFGYVCVRCVGVGDVYV